MNNKVIAITGGGTGGHVFPGLAVAEEISRMADFPCEILWIGSDKGMEKHIVGKSPFPFYSIPAGKLRRYFSFSNFVDIFRVLAGFIKSISLLKRLKVDVLFSKGGFVSVPPVIAAWFLRIPVVSHESDLDPGLATKINAPFSQKILVPYKESLSRFGSKEKVVVTGNPVRKAILEGDAKRGRELFSVPEGKKIVLVLGGSLGALEINNLIDGIIDSLIPEAFVIHQMGELGFKKSDREGYITAPFFTDDLPHLLAAADLVVSRAGAGTLWESGVMGKASILIPLGTGSSRGDQIRNALYFVGNDAALLAGKDVTGAVLLDLILTLLKDDKKRNKMGSAASRLCNGDAAVRIAGIIANWI